MLRRWHSRARRDLPVAHADTQVLTAEASSACKAATARAVLALCLLVLGRNGDLTCLPELLFFGLHIEGCQCLDDRAVRRTWRLVHHALSAVALALRRDDSIVDRDVANAALAASRGLEELHGLVLEIGAGG